MAFASAAIRQAVIDLAEGAITGIRDLDSGVFRFGVFDGQPLPAMIAKGIQKHNARHWFDVSVSRARDHASTPVSAIGNRRNTFMTVTVDIWTHTATTAQEDKRKTLLAELESDCDDLIQALHYPGNLTDTQDGTTTGLIGGMLFGPGGSGAPEYVMVSADWKTQTIRSRIDASALVQVAQAVA